MIYRIYDYNKLFDIFIPKWKEPYNFRIFI